MDMDIDTDLGLPVRPASEVAVGVFLFSSSHKTRAHVSPLPKHGNASHGTVPPPPTVERFGVKSAVVPSPVSHYHPSAIEPWLEDAFSSFSSFSASASSVLRAAASVFSVVRHFWTSLRAYSSLCVCECGMVCGQPAGHWPHLLTRGEPSGGGELQVVQPALARLR